MREITDLLTEEPTHNDAGLMMGWVFVAAIAILLGSMAAAESAGFDPVVGGVSAMIVALFTASAFIWVRL